MTVHFYKAASDNLETKSNMWKRFSLNSKKVLPKISPAKTNQVVSGAVLVEESGSCALPVRAVYAISSYDDDDDEEDDDIIGFNDAIDNSRHLRGSSSSVYSSANSAINDATTTSDVTAIKPNDDVTAVNRKRNRVEKLKKKIRTKTFLCATISLSLLALVVAGAFLLYQSRKIILYTQIIVCSVHKM